MWPVTDDTALIDANAGIRLFTTFGIRGDASETPLGSLSCTSTISSRDPLVWFSPCSTSWTGDLVGLANHPHLRWRNVLVEAHPDWPMAAPQSGQQYVYRSVAPQLQCSDFLAESLFRSLRFLPSGYVVPLNAKQGSRLPDSPYHIFYNLYKPSTPFKKTTPPPPDFSVVVVK